MKRMIATLLVLLWSVSLAGAASAGNRVWCIGADGHAGVEAAFGVKCAAGPFDREALDTAADAQVSADHCGTCRDIPLASSSTAISVLAKLIPAPVKKPVPAPFIATILPVGAVDPTLSHRAAYPNPPDPRSRLPEHRSVVLLI